mmetsp:Transcript_3313/g.7791  ORF Transcript_3313/g.7791 Transcript_3313/m.7791 type:complete len:355 (+) Transcript_3313:124-1188(+)|eukprot:g13612.t1
MAVSRSDLKTRHAQWMREHSLSLEASSKMAETSDSGVALLSRLSQNIEKAVRQELTQQITHKNVAEELEKLVSDRLSAHACPICMCVMSNRSVTAAPSTSSTTEASVDVTRSVDRSPLLLFPCGHNLCTYCAARLKGDKCPYCRAAIEHKALNRPLLEMILAFENTTDVCEKVNREPDFVEPLSSHSLKTAADPGAGGERGGMALASTAGARATTCSGSGISGEAEERDEKRQRQFYTQKYRHYLARYNVLATELEAATGDLEKLEKEERVLEGDIGQDEAEVQRLYGLYEEKMMALNAKKGRWKRLREVDRPENEQRVSLVKKSIVPLQRDKDKCLIILEQKFGVDIAEVEGC